MHRITAAVASRIAASVADLWMDRYIRTAILEGAAGVPPYTWTRDRDGLEQALAATNASGQWAARDSHMYRVFVRAAGATLGRSDMFDSAEDLVQRVITGDTRPGQPGGELYAVGRQLSEHIGKGMGAGDDSGFRPAMSYVLKHIKQRALNEIRGMTRERARIGPGVQEGLESDDGRMDQYPGTTSFSSDAADIAFGEFLMGPQADKARRWLLELWSRELRDSDMAVVRAWLNDPDKNYTQLGRELGITGSFIGKAIVRAKAIAVDAIQRNPPDFVRELLMKEDVAPLGYAVRRASTLSPDDFHVSYPDPKTIRVLVSKPGSGTYSGFVEARVGPNQVADLVRQFKYSGLTVDPNDIEAAIEMA
jgi:hypothetical protein